MITENLFSALHAELARVRALLRLKAIGPTTMFRGLVFIEAIHAGEAALQSGDPVDLVRAIERLRGCTV